MLVLTAPTDLHRINHPGIRQLVTLRFQQLGSDFSDSIEFIIVEPGDDTAEVEAALGFPLQSSLDGLPFDHPDYVPLTEFIEGHTHDDAIIFEPFVCVSDSGAGTTIFVPDEEAVPPDLLAVARAWATPAVSSP